MTERLVKDNQVRHSATLSSFINKLKTALFTKNKLKTIILFTKNKLKTIILFTKDKLKTVILFTKDKFKTVLFTKDKLKTVILFTKDKLETIILFTKTFGERSLSFLAPSVWNSLPSGLRNFSTLPLFKSRLKTHLFTTAFCQ